MSCLSGHCYSLSTVSTRSGCREDHGTGLGEQAARDEGDLRPRYLAGSALTAQLNYRFVEEADPVQPALGQLATGRVDGKLAARPDAPAVIDPVAELADPAEAEGLDPRDGHHREAVVQLRHVDVGRRDRRLRPQVPGARDRPTEEVVVAEDPVAAWAGAERHGLHHDRCLAQVPRPF